MRKRKIRYCRYCHKKLDSSHYFFCNNECMEKFMMNYTTLDEVEVAQKTISQWTEEIGEAYLKNEIVPLCKKCKKDCKIKTTKEAISTLISFECVDFQERS
ncbi:MAG: hypothetical protein QW279_01235 [Candidatus Jordarchaeaceae archaeon]